MMVILKQIFPDWDKNQIFKKKFAYNQHVLRNKLKPKEWISNYNYNTLITN